ncbi:hypothetical protein O181_108731 [Austropuccinia psidii MF-1]|uniref:Uncharacterized protein n=1 Tax=Austropuccinia psidii MF-1 TaxID=1389203 RepID=A0A9Q3PQ94_9BASI|nr:hypothetical protein [Austropuccinia psidii MF-1]
MLTIGLLNHLTNKYLTSLVIDCHIFTIQIKTRLQVTKVISSCPASVTQSPKPTALSSLESSPTNSRNSPKLSPSLFVSETIHQIYTEGATFSFDSTEAKDHSFITSNGWANGFF